MISYYVQYSSNASKMIKESSLVVIKVHAHCMCVHIYVILCSGVGSMGAPMKILSKVKIHLCMNVRIAHTVPITDGIVLSLRLTYSWCRSTPSLKHLPMPLLCLI